MFIPPISSWNLPSRLEVAPTSFGCHSCFISERHVGPRIGEVLTFLSFLATLMRLSCDRGAGDNKPLLILMTQLSASLRMKHNLRRSGILN